MNRKAAELLFFLFHCRDRLQCTSNQHPNALTYIKFMLCIENVYMRVYVIVCKSMLYVSILFGCLQK